MWVLRRIRGLIGIAGLWGVVISAIGTAFILTAMATGLISPYPATDWTQWIGFAARVAARDFLLGTVGGAAFAVVLAAVERHRTIDKLSARRLGAWGFLASSLSIGTPAIVAVSAGAIISRTALVGGTIASGVLGAALSVGMLKIARRASVPLAAQSQT